MRAQQEGVNTSEHEVRREQRRVQVDERTSHSLRVRVSEVRV